MVFLLTYVPFISVADVMAAPVSVFVTACSSTNRASWLLALSNTGLVVLYFKCRYKLCTISTMSHIFCLCVFI